MRSRKLIAWLLCLALMSGVISPVYGAENLVGTAGQTTLDGTDGTDDAEMPLSDESVSDIAAETDGLNMDGAEMSSENEETDAFPDTVSEDIDADPYAVPESEQAVGAADHKDDSVSATESKTDSLTDSIPTDSSTPDLLKEQETLVGTTYTSAVPVEGKTYYIRCASNRDLALTVSGNSTGNGANIFISKLTKTYDQKFMCRKLSGDMYAFFNFHSGKALRVADNKAANKTNVWQYEFQSASAARWKLLKNPDGSYRIASRLNDNYVMDVAAGELASGTNIQLYRWNKTNAQKFIFTETPIPSYGGTVQLRPESSVSMCAAPEKLSSAVGADIQLANADNTDALTYNAVQVSAGYYVLLNRSNGLALTAHNAGNTPGTNVVQEKRRNSYDQQWLMRKNADGSFTFLSRLNSTLALAPKNGAGTAGTTIFLATDKGYTSQKFYCSIYEPSEIPSTEVYIRSVVNSDRVLDVSAAGTADGTNIDCYDWNETAAQRFKIESVTCGGKVNYWFKISSVLSGKVLEVAGASASEHANIQLGTFNRTKAQLWHPVLKSDGSYVLLSALNSKMCMEMTGSEAYGANVRLATSQSNAKQKWYFTTVRITKTTIAYSDHNTVTVRASGAKQASDTGLAYLFAISPYGKTIKGYTPLASAPMSTSYIFHASLNKNNSHSLLHRKFYIATLTHGTYRIISNGFYIQNPDAAATNTKAFPTPARGTKKGLKTSADSQNLAKSLNCSHVIMDLPIDGFLNGSDLAYKYEGTTYHFNSIINVYADRIRTYNNLGIVVSGIFYMYDSSKTAYMLPSAASGSRRHSATLYALNTRDSNRKRLEALFACLAEKWSTKDCTVANWIYGNELQQYNVYHYAGDISYSEYHEALAEEFRLFNSSIKSRWSNARTYISLDHNWNLSWTLNGSYNGMKLTADFNTDLARQGLAHWDMAMHPYPSPEQDCRFWNRAFTITNAGNAQQITMLNARYFSDYIKKTYGSSTHIIMSEIGLSSVYNGSNQEGQQAASVAFAYYLAEFDPNIDMIAIHRDYDNSGETSGGWWLGIHHSNGSPKPSADVFRYMDTKNWDSHVSHYMNSYIGGNWKSQIHGFDANFFRNK